MQGLDLLVSPPSGCKVWVALESLGRDDPEGAEVLRRAVLGGDVSAGTIVQVFALNGHLVGSTVVREHRRGVCSCARR